MRKIADLLPDNASLIDETEILVKLKEWLLISRSMLKVQLLSALQLVWIVVVFIEYLSISIFKR